MKIYAIANIINANKETMGFRLLDIDSKKVTNSSYQSIYEAIRCKSFVVENIVISNGKLVGSNGSIDRIPKILENGSLIGESSLTIIGCLGNQGYIVSDFKGNIKQASIEDTIEYASKNGISNGKVVTKDNKTFISAIVGTYELAESLNKKSNYQLMQEYQAKQNLVGNIFDFRYNKETGEISISKYYDIPSREIVTIPDFVDELLHTTDKHLYEYGIFTNCRYINKIIMHSNIKGRLVGLFARYKGDRLDLSDFDTSNITDMSYMFDECEATLINLGDKFNTYKVDDMSLMFHDCKVKEINLGNMFDTSKVEEMTDMFDDCEAESIAIGNSNILDNRYLGNADLKYLLSVSGD